MQNMFCVLLLWYTFLIWMLGEWDSFKRLGLKVTQQRTYRGWHSTVSSFLITFNKSTNICTLNKCIQFFSFKWWSKFFLLVECVMKMLKMLYLPFLILLIYLNRDNKIPWHSSCITERVSSNIVKTASGGTYVLVGKMSHYHNLCKQIILEQTFHSILFQFFLHSTN